MKKTRFTEEQMVTILREADARPVPEVAKKHGVSAQTIYGWRKHFGTLEPADVKRLRQLEQENGRLKKMVADREIEIDVLKEITRKKWSAHTCGGSRSPTLRIYASRHSVAGAYASDAERGQRAAGVVCFATNSAILVGWPGGSFRMRDDMAKVVTERPRRGHGNKSKKTTGLPIRRYDPDADYDEPVRLPIARRRQYGWNAKEFSDLINPLKRYLRSCIGRPWRKVHSELSQKLDRRSISGAHIWDHVMWEIETDCYIGPDRLAHSNNRRYGHGKWPIDGLYVDPRTRLIREQRPRRRGPSVVSLPLSIPTMIVAPATNDGN